MADDDLIRLDELEQELYRKKFHIEDHQSRIDLAKKLQKPIDLLYPGYTKWHQEQIARIKVLEQELGLEPTYQNTFGKIKWTSP